MTKEIINLNLITTYPVKWNRYKILRDFIQNFFDSVPNEEFYSRFSYEYKDYTLTMRCKDVAYSYEWLLHIGASSKTSSEENNAGYFGEGFKIASLCAMRDYDYIVETSSSNWSIKVVENDINIDGNNTKSLAYELLKKDEEDNDTVLTLENFDKNDMEDFYSALYSFYYKENPLLGEEIYSSKNCAIYHRSDVKKERGYPYTFNCSGEGIVFAAYQARGSLKEPLVFCYHSYRDNDRDRDFFSKIDNIDMIIRCVTNIPSEKALELLIYYEKMWYIYPSEKYGYLSYYSVIKNLIFNLITKKELVDEFLRLYPNLLYAEKISSSNKKALNIRKYCLEWVRKNPEYTLVQDAFRLLGISSVESKCEELKVLPEVKEQSIEQSMYINVLEECVKEVFEGFLQTEELPKCKVITNLKASVSGYASISNSKIKGKNRFGFRYRNKLNYICIKDIYLESEGFSTALTVYIHELCHTFGGDKSESFSYAMTEAMEILLCNMEKVNKFKEKWERI